MGRSSKAHTNRFGCCSSNPIRLFRKVSLLSLSIVSHNAFEFTVLIVIILNSIKMALDDPLAQTSTPLQQQL